MGTMPEVTLGGGRWASKKKVNEMITEAVHRSPGIYLTAQENLR